MKRLLILLLVFLIGGAWVGQKMVQDPGYVLVAYGETTIETSLWVLLILLVVGFLLTHWAVNLFFRLRLPTRQYRQWRSNRQARTAQIRTRKGLQAFSEGRWWQAQRLLTQAAGHAEQPQVNYLTAARAAQELGEQANADKWLGLAREANPRAEATLAMAEAELLASRGQQTEAAQLLHKLHNQLPKHNGVLRQLAELYREQSDWNSLAKILPTIRRQKALVDQQVTALETLCFSQMLDGVLPQLPAETSDSNRFAALNREWQAMPAELANDKAMVHHYVQLQLEAGAHEQAEQFLRDKIKQQWDESLVAVYGTVKADQPKQLTVALSWLRQHSDSPAVQLTIGRLHSRNQQWQAAIDAYQASLAIAPSEAAYAELVEAQQQNGEAEKSLETLNASRLWRQGASQAEPSMA